MMRISSVTVVADSFNVVAVGCCAADVVVEVVVTDPADDGRLSCISMLSKPPVIDAVAMFDPPRNSDGKTVDERAGDVPAAVVPSPVGARRTDGEAAGVSTTTWRRLGPVVSAVVVVAAVRRLAAAARPRFGRGVVWKTTVARSDVNHVL